MSLGAVLPIHSRFANKIYSGNKRYEFRTRRPSKKVDFIAIYETSPVCAVTGFARVKEIIEGKPQDIWNLTRDYAGISYSFFNNYFSGKKSAVAYCLEDVTRFDEAISLSDIGIMHVPQSYQYLEGLEQIYPGLVANRCLRC